MWGSGRGQEAQQRAGGRRGAEAACRVVLLELRAELLLLPCEIAVAWSDVCHPAEGTAQLWLPVVAKGGARLGQVRRSQYWVFFRLSTFVFCYTCTQPALSLWRGDGSKFCSPEEHLG